jgi:uncharacterized lipoprotein YbaY
MKKPMAVRPPLALALSLAALLFSCATQQTTVQVPTNVNLPRQVRVVAQSCDNHAMYQTVIDLENDEIVILVYNEMNLLNVIRTGIKADAKGQPAVTGTDAPAAAGSREK